MESKTFKLESSSLGYEMLFENGMVAVSLFRKLKECHLDQVTKVVQKQTSLGGGDEISFRIFFTDNNGKEQKFPWIQARVTSPATKECLEHMRAVFPSNTEWTDQRNEKMTDAAGRTVYDMQYLLFGYAGAGLSRGAQLWIYMICLAVLVIPLFYFGYILITGGYRVYTNSDEIELKKVRSKKFAWGDLAKVNLTNVDVIQNYANSTHVMKMELVTKTGKKSRFVMRYNHAVPLLKEMAEHGLVSEQLVEQYA